MPHSRRLRPSMCHSRTYPPAHPPQQHPVPQPPQVSACCKSVKATLRDLVSLKVAFTDIRFTSPAPATPHAPPATVAPRLPYPSITFDVSGRRPLWTPVGLQMPFSLSKAFPHRTAPARGDPAPSRIRPCGATRAPLQLRHRRAVTAQWPKSGCSGPSPPNPWRASQNIVSTDSRVPRATSARTSRRRRSGSPVRPVRTSRSAMSCRCA